MPYISEQFKALGDPVRLEIVRMLAGKELCVCDILGAFRMSQPTISHHLKVLKAAGIVTDKKEGKWSYYRLNTETLEGLAAFFAPLKAGGQAERIRTCEEE